MFPGHMKRSRFSLIMASSSLDCQIADNCMVSDTIAVNGLYASYEPFSRSRLHGNRSGSCRSNRFITNTIRPQSLSLPHTDQPTPRLAQNKTLPITQLHQL